MKEQLFRLKEEAKKYNSLHDAEMPLEWWKQWSVREEALEEVKPEPEIELRFAGEDNEDMSFIRKLKNGVHTLWTDEEICDFERFLKLGGFEGVDKLAIKWHEDSMYYSSFNQYLKEKGL